MKHVTLPRFRLGQTLATPAALLALERAGDSLSTLIGRHQCGDWGETCEEDAQMNEEALEGGGACFPYTACGAASSCGLSRKPTAAPRRFCCQKIIEDYNARR